MRKKSIKSNVKFCIEITLLYCDSKQTLFESDVVYHTQTQKTDHITINTNDIIIKGARCDTKAFVSFQKQNDLADFYKSTIYDQMLKSLLFVYLTTKKVPVIGSIYIILNDDEESKIIKTNTEINFLTGKSLKLFDNLQFDIDGKKIFEKNEKGKCFYDSSLFLLQANHEDSQFHAFERLWRSFNLIYNMHSGSTKDAVGLDKIIDYIKANQSHFTSSITKLISIEDSVFDFLRWEELITNSVKRNNLVELVSDYKTERIINIFKSREKWLLKCRNTILDKKRQELSNKEQGSDRYKKLQTQIAALSSTDFYRNTIIEVPTEDEKLSDFLKLILRNYIYFVRCSYFHGSKNDDKYKLFTANNNLELDFINSFMSQLIIDCLTDIENL